MENNWVPFDVLSLLEKERQPKVQISRSYEINERGDIRYLDVRRKRYVNVKPVTAAGVEYFVTIIGYGSGNMVTVRIPIKDLLRRFFKIV